MWLISTDEQAENSFTFRILPGASKTIGRAPRADFIVDTSQGLDPVRLRIGEILKQTASLPRRRS